MANLCQDVYVYTLGEDATVPRKDHSNKTRDIVAKLERDGWRIARKGPGDHVQYRHPNRAGRVTIDAGAREIPTGTLRSIYRQANWEW